MNLADALVQLFTDTPEQAPSIQAKVNDIWTTIPLEWNVAMRLADICEGEVRMLGVGGQVTREYCAQGKVA